MGENKKEIKAREVPKGTKLDPQVVEDWSNDLAEKMKPIIDEAMYRRAQAMARAPFITVTN